MPRALTATASRSACRVPAGPRLIAHADLKDANALHLGLTPQLVREQHAVAVLSRSILLQRMGSGAGALSETGMPHAFAGLTCCGCMLAGCERGVRTHGGHPFKAPMGPPIASSRCSLC